MKPPIVFVHAFGGPPIDHVMPVLAHRCAVHALLLSTITPYNKAVIQEFAQTVTQRPDMSATHVVDLIIRHARDVDTRRLHVLPGGHTLRLEALPQLIAALDSAASDMCGEGEVAA